MKSTLFTRLKSDPLRNRATCGPESQRDATPVGSRRGDDDDERQVRMREVRVRPDAPWRSAVPAGSGVALLAAPKHVGHEARVAAEEGQAQREQVLPAEVL